MHAQGFKANGRLLIYPNQSMYHVLAYNLKSSKVYEYIKLLQNSRAPSASSLTSSFCSINAHSTPAPIFLLLNHLFGQTYIH